MAEFKQIESAVVSLDKQVKILQTDLQKLITTVNSNSKSQADLAAKTRNVENATKSISALEKERIRVANQTKKTFAQSLALQEKGTKTLMKGKLRLREQQRKLNEELKKELGITKKRSGLFKSMTKSIIAAGAAMLGFRAVLNVLKKGLATIIDFEKAMSEVKAITGATDDEFKALEQNALKLGATTSKTSQQVAGLQKEFAKLGFTTSEILAATDATIDLSIAAGSDLAESAVVAASTIRGFGLSANETQRVVDVMAKSFTSSALDLEKFKTIMATVAPVAKASGKSIEFATSQAAILADAGLDASTAGTSLRNMFLELNKQGLTWEQGLEKINTSTNKNVTALELFGKRGATAALILAENTEKTGELEKALDGAAGSAEEMARIMEDNLAGDISKAKSAWEGFILSLNQGEGGLSKFFRRVTQFATDLFDAFRTLAIGFKQMKLEIWMENLAEQAKEDVKEFDAYINRMEELTGTTQNASEAAERFLRVSEERLEKLRAIENMEKLAGKAQSEAAKNEIDLLQNRIAAVNEYVGQLGIQIDKEKEAAKQQEQAKTTGAIAAAKVVADEQKKIDDEVYNERAQSYQDFIAKKREEELAELTRQNEENVELARTQQEKEEQAKLDVIEAADQERLRQEQLLLDAKAELNAAATQAIQQVASDQFSSFIDNNLNSFREGQEAQEQILKDKLDKGKISEEQYEKEVKKLRLRTRQEEAKAEKKKGLFDIAIATAIAIVKALPNLPLAAAMAGIGAVQAATVAAKPIPKFKHGSNGMLQLDTTAIVGDGGKPELITTPQGDFISPSTDTMVHLPKGSQVFGGDSPETQAALQGGVSEEYMKMMVSEQKATRKAIKNINPAPQWTASGLRERDRKTGIITNRQIIMRP